MGDTVGCPGSQATAGDEAGCLVRGEVPRDSEDTRVEVAELLEERRAHVYARRESDIFSGSMGAGDSVTDVVGAAAGALVTDGRRRGFAVGGVPNLDLLLV